MGGEISNNSKSYTFENFKESVISQFECTNQDVKNYLIKSDSIFTQYFNQLDRSDGKNDGVYQGDERMYNAYVKNAVALLNDMARIETEYREQKANKKENPGFMDKIAKGD